MSLRARLLAVVAALTLAGLVAADVATYVALRSFLVQRVDRTVDTSAGVLARSPGEHSQIDEDTLAQLAQTTPGVFLGLINADGKTTWSPIGLRPGESAPPPPTLPKAIPASTFTVHGSDGTGYRAQVEPIPGGQRLVIAAPLTDVEDTLGHLLVVELVVTLIVLAGVVGGGLWLVRVGLRPLSRIETTAAAIGAGDLSRRVEGEDPRTEIGRLAGSLNAMLGQIEDAFAERTASEERMRRFVGDASHELRTPLASVRAYAELFDRGARDRPEDLERCMAGIERESRRMGILVDDLLLLARLDQHRPAVRRPVDLAAVAEDAAEVARTLAPDREVVLDAPRPVVVEGDAEALRRAVDNLLANVRAHTPAGTATRVAVRADGEAAVLEVEDEGPGFTADQQARAFQRFYRGDPSRSRDGGGAGLGLAIVAGIAEAHGGHAEVGRGAGGGGCVRIRIPGVRQGAPAPEAAPAP